MRWVARACGGLLALVACGADDGGPASASTTTSSETTSAVELCGLGEGEEPWFEVSHQGAILGPSDNTFRLSCGVQGSFMFEYVLELGGIEPAGDLARFSVTMSVPGHDNGPAGAFYQQTSYDVFLGCEVFGGPDTRNRILVLTPDELLEVTDLDGLPASLHVEMFDESGNIISDADGTIDATEDESWECCRMGTCL